MRPSTRYARSGELNIAYQVVGDGPLDIIYVPGGLKLTACFMLVDPSGREQTFYSTFAPKLHHGGEAVLKIQHWLQAHQTEKITLEMMAERAGLGERTFLRRFQKATGINPTEYCQQLRIAKARELLEISSIKVEQIAWQIGYEDPGAFRKLLGLSPGEYRRRFFVGADTPISAIA